MPKLKLQYCGHMMWRADSLEKTLSWESWGKVEKGTTEDGMVGWHHPSTQWTWVWANSERYCKTVKPGMLQSMGLQRVGHDWATEQQQQTYLRSEASKRYLLLPLHFNIVLEILVASGIEETKLSLLVNGIRFKKIICLFIYWLCWVFFAACRLSLVEARRGYSLVVVCGPLIVVASLVAKHGF